MSSRGWTFDSDDEDPRLQDPEYLNKVMAECDLLARKWNDIHGYSERRFFQKQWERENGYLDFDDAELYEQYELEEKLQRELEIVQLDLIESRLLELGARMTRLYEHWNEDERYMEYMEVDRFA